jgi:hypothetical protein
MQTGKHFSFSVQFLVRCGQVYTVETRKSVRVKFPQNKEQGRRAFERVTSLEISGKQNLLEVNYFLVVLGRVVVGNIIDVSDVRSTLQCRRTDSNNQLFWKLEIGII